MLNGRHNAIYRPLVEAAWRAYCSRTGAEPGNKAMHEAWYRKALIDSPLQIRTSKQISSPQDFDAICLYFATLAGDDEQIGYWSSANERRALCVLQQTMRRLDVDEHHVAGVARHMGFISPADPRRISDLPAELILKINTALDVHARRIARTNNA